MLRPTLFATVKVGGLREEPLEATGVPHSDDLRLTERFRRIDWSTLVVDVTGIDPTAWTPFRTTRASFTAATDPWWEPRELLCTPAADFTPTSMSIRSSP